MVLVFALKKAGPDRSEPQYPKHELLSKAWRPVSITLNSFFLLYFTLVFEQNAVFHTNNLIESYHNQLKRFYLGRSRNHRVDRIIYLLSQVVALDYRQEALQLSLGVRPVCWWLQRTRKERLRMTSALKEPHLWSELLLKIGQVVLKAYIVTHS